MPLVTVVMATYNWSSVLPYSIGSVLRQQHTDFELLVVGDGCTDDSEAVVGAITDPRVRWINLPRNFGHQAYPNNEGIRQARGEYIAYLGHDDLWLPHHLKVLLEAMIEPVRFAHGVALIVPGDGRSPFCFPSSPRTRPPFFIPPTCVMHHRSLADEAGGWRDYREMRVDPEEELWTRMQAAGHELVLVPRLTAIKLPAARRKDVYKLKQSNEQAAWLKRIDSEPDLEAVELAKALLVKTSRTPVERIVQSPLVRRVSQRARLELFWRGKHRIDLIRKYKGLPPRPPA